MALYEDFEGDLSKWDYWENIASHTAVIVGPDANFPTSHLEMYSSYPWTSYRSSLLSNGDVGDGKYIKCGLYRFDFIQSFAGSLVIRADATGDNFYIAFLETVQTRIFKVVNWTLGSRNIYQLAVSAALPWAENTNYSNVEFYQDESDTLIVKQDGNIACQVVDTSITGDRIGFAQLNEGYLWVDNVYDNRAEPLATKNFFDTTNYLHLRRGRL